MVKKFFLSLLILLVGVTLLTSAAFVFREPLLRQGANYALARNALSISTLRDLDISRSDIRVAELVMSLPSGQVLEVDNLQLGFSHRSLLAMPQMESLAVGSLRLRDAATPQSEEESEAPLLLSELLQLLRDFPLPQIVVTEVEVPQWYEPMQLSITHVDSVLALDLSSGALHLLGSFNQASAEAPALLNVNLTREGDALGTLEVSLIPDESAYTLEGRGRLVFADLAELIGELQASTRTQALQNLGTLPLQSADLNWNLQGRVADDLYGTLASTNPTSFNLGIAAGSTLVLGANLIEGLSTTNISIPRDLTLTVATGAGLGLSHGIVPLQLSSNYTDAPISLNGEFNISTCLFDNSVTCTVAYVGELAYSDYEARGMFNASLPSLRGGLGSYHLRTTDLALAGLPERIPGFDVDLAATLTDDRLTFSTPLVLRGLPSPFAVTAKGSYAFERAVLDVQADLPALAFDDKSGSLSSWIGDWPYNADVLAGSLQGLAATVRWQKDAPMTANVHASLQEVGGFYESFFFSGLNGALEADLSFGDTLTLQVPPLALRLASIDVGVPIENVTLDFAIDQSTQTLLVSAFRAEVVGGTLTGNQLQYDLDAAINNLTLSFNSLDLTRMMELIEYKGVLATGKLSGAIPLTLSEDAVLVTGGTLSADAPGGVLRYIDNGAAAAAGNPQLDLVNQVLSNFQYDVLSSTIDYTREGELLLGMQLQGHNPDLGSDQPIHLNLNVSDNVPALLNSLRATRNIEEFLEEYQNSPP